ncbi:MAG TPA: TlpA disulfide reductase family protein [Symbiobacteriaceae bacterium]|nr:TlpA disulfide reductase family protein [Symbiobacteriaceae bacterium]
MRRSVLVLTLAGALLAGCMGGKAPAPAPAPVTTPEPAPAAVKKPAPLKGYPAPEITGKDVRTGDVVSLSQFSGKIVFVNFWATWCPPCRQEMPDLQTLQGETGERVKVLAVGGDESESAERLLAFAKDQKLTFTVVHDRGEGLMEYRVIALPTTFVVDQHGVIREKIQGAISLDHMRELVAQAEAAGKKQP